MGNLRSAAKALEHVGADVLVTADHDRLGAVGAIVLPGVGAFPEAMRRIRRLGLDSVVTERVAAGVPLLGICLGMQLLFESSEELGGSSGLALLAGTVDALDPGELKLPHIGWSPIQTCADSALTRELTAGEPFYFVHTFVARPRVADLVATSVHGETFAAVVRSGNVHGTQFHPEKSSLAGLAMLRNFVVAATPAEVA